MKDGNIKPLIGIVPCIIIVTLCCIAVLLCISESVFVAPENTTTFYESYEGENNINNEKLLELYISYYRSNNLSLNTNIFLQIVLNVVAFRMMYSNEQKMTIPFVEISLSVNALSILIPLALVVLWLQFGFEFFNLIISRIGGHEIIDTMTDQEHNNCLLFGLFRDGKIMDGWFHLYHDYNCVVFFEKGYISEMITRFFLSITYCILVASTNANSIFIPVLFLGNQNGYKHLSIFISMLALVTILLSHFLFYLGFKNELQYMILFFMTAFGAVFLRRARGKAPHRTQQKLLSS